MIPTLFFVSLVVLAVALVLGILNICMSFKSHDMDSGIFKRHGILMVFYVLGGFGTAVFGIWWLVSWLAPLVEKLTSG